MCHPSAICDAGSFFPRVTVALTPLCRSSRQPSHVGGRAWHRVSKSIALAAAVIGASQVRPVSGCDVVSSASGEGAGEAGSTLACTRLVPRWFPRFRVANVILSDARPKSIPTLRLNIRAHPRPPARPEATAARTCTQFTV